MTNIESLIRTHVQKRESDGYPTSYGQYRFVVLPRVGELIHLQFGEDELCLKVVAIDHYGYSEDDNLTPWDGVITLTCEDGN